MNDNSVYSSRTIKFPHVENKRVEQDAPGFGVWMLLVGSIGSQMFQVRREIAGNTMILKLN